MKRTIAVLLLIPPIMMTVWVLYRAFWVPDNHIGFEPSLFIGAAGFSVIAAALSQSRLQLLACAMTLATVVVIGETIHFNLLLQYEEWIRLGMPDKPSWAALGR